MSIILLTLLTDKYLSIGEQGVHPLKEARLQHVGFIENEDYLLISATRATEHSPQVIIKVSSSVLAVDLTKRKASKSSYMCDRDH